MLKHKVEHIFNSRGRFTDVFYKGGYTRIPGIYPQWEALEMVKRWRRWRKENFK